jgi:hypothetical protein
MSDPAVEREAMEWAEKAVAVTGRASGRDLPIVMARELRPLLAEVARLREENEAVFRKLADGTLHVLYCNANHSEPVGKGICVCPAGRYLKGELSSLKAEHEERVKGPENIIQSWRQAAKGTEMQLAEVRTERDELSVMAALATRTLRLVEAARAFISSGEGVKEVITSSCLCGSRSPNYHSCSACAQGHAGFVCPAPKPGEEVIRFCRCGRANCPEDDHPVEPLQYDARQRYEKQMHEPAVAPKPEERITCPKCKADTCKAKDGLCYTCRNAPFIDYTLEDKAMAEEEAPKPPEHEHAAPKLADVLQDRLTSLEGENAKLKMDYYCEVMGHGYTEEEAIALRAENAKLRAFRDVGGPEIRERHRRRNINGLDWCSNADCIQKGRHQWPCPPIAALDATEGKS